MPLDSKRKEIREQLRQIFPIVTDFDAFCVDHFPDVKTRFSDSMDRVGRENLLLELHEPEEISKFLMLYGKNRSEPRLRRSTALLMLIGVLLALSGSILLIIDHRSDKNTLSVIPAAQIAIPSNISKDLSVKEDSESIVSRSHPVPGIAEALKERNMTINTGTITTGDNSPVGISQPAGGTVINKGNIRTGNGSSVHIGGTTGRNKIQ